jgi:hypothetical protein
MTRTPAQSAKPRESGRGRTPETRAREMGRRGSGRGRGEVAVEVSEGRWAVGVKLERQELVSRFCWRVSGRVAPKQSHAWTVADGRTGSKQQAAGSRQRAAGSVQQQTRWARWRARRRLPRRRCLRAAAVRRRDGQRAPRTPPVHAHQHHHRRRCRRSQDGGSVRRPRHCSARPVCAVGSRQRVRAGAQRATGRCSTAAKQ